MCKANQYTLDDLKVKKDDEDLYGKNYWLSHQTQGYHYSPLSELEPEEMIEALAVSPSGRLILVLLDFNNQKDVIKRKWDEPESDRDVQADSFTQNNVFQSQR